MKTLLHSIKKEFTAYGGGIDTEVVKICAVAIAALILVFCNF